MKKTVLALAAASLLSVSPISQAHDDPKDLECANIKRTYDARVRDLKIHLERVMPNHVVVERITPLTLMLAPLGGIRGFDGVFHESSAQAYKDEIDDMLRRGKNQECAWALQ